MSVVPTVSQKSQEKPIGNTISIGARTQLYCWFFTLPMEECSASQLSQLLKGFCKKFNFQGEKAKSGFLHWQGNFSLITKEYFQTVKNRFPCSIHLEATKHVFKAVEYCQKNDSRIEGPYNEKSTFVTTITYEQMYKWQKDVIDYINKPVHPRELLWIYDNAGAKGKTSLAKYLCVHHNACFLSNGKTSDISFAIGDDVKIVVINFTRDNEERINYGSIEAIKDGMVFSGKYESKSKIFDPPHIIIFANFSPRLESMSLDRWNIINLADE